MKQRYFLTALLSVYTLATFAQSVEFVRNDGQWKGPFAYKASTGNSDVFLSGNSFTYLIAHPSNPDRMEAVRHGQTPGPARLDFHAYRMHFEGAAPQPLITAAKEQSWYYNYFLGKDPAQWKTGIHPALAVDYKGLYDGIDLHVSSDKKNVKYEFLVAAGKDPDEIRLRYEGTDGITIKGDKLVIKTAVGDVEELRPYAFQYTAQGRREVPCRYRLRGQTVTYDLYQGYDRQLPLIIDPTVVFSTFTGSTADNWGFTATYDAAGNFYAGGIAFDNGFPVSTGAFQTTFAGGVSDPNFQTSDAHGNGFPCDMSVIKYNPTGTTKIYATYIGGTDNEQPHSMIVDGSDNLIIAGRTYSNNFPVTAGAYDGSFNDSADIVVIKLNSTATALLGSTYVGGSGVDGTNYNGSEYVYGNLKYNYGDDARSEVLVDNAGNIYVAAATRSSNFPTVNATQATKSGGQDAVVFKLNSTLSTLLWSTYLGGTSDDAGYVMALDGSQTHLYVGGGTMSTNFPTTGGTWQAGYQGGITDGYIARYLNSGAYPLEKVCFVGTTNRDQVYGLQIDLDNNVYAMGQSLGGTFPVSAGVYSNPNSSQFVLKLNADLSNRVFSTVFGSGDATHTNISPVAFLVDTCQNIYISGWGGNLSIPGIATTIGTTTGMPVTPNAYQSATDGYDFYFIVLGRNASSLLYGTFYGRNSSNANFGEHVDGGTSRFDKTGVVYQAICGGCGGTAGPPLPTTTGSFSPTNGSSNCNLASLKIAFELGAVNAGAQAAPTTRGCPPLTVQFRNNSTNATTYVWDFRDNTPTSTAVAPQHTFTTPGVYNVRLIANNPNACKTIDTTYVTITVDNNQVTSDFNYAILDSCGPFTVSFTNSSTYGSTPGAQNFTRFTWLFGDNTSYTGTTPPVHNYSGTGTYTVTLVMRDTTACNSPDTIRKTFTISNTKVRAAFSIRDSICVGTALTFTDNSTNARTIKWRFGDGDSSALATVSHTFDTAGTFTVKLYAINPNACNKIDSMMKTVTVSGRPKAGFTFAPVIPVANTPIDYTNTSVGATSYTWAFGDGNTSSEVSPSHLFRRTGRYITCLVAKNAAGCTDTVCKQVEADIRTGVELPTAFSPNGDGSNDRFFPRGGGIERMDFKIFNRWGQLVFEATNVPANDPAYGWDGTYQGKEQEMDVYAFVLNVTFIDGTTVQRKGNVTLLR